jgi:phage antirepressor YoqD-like protein
VAKIIGEGPRKLFAKLRSMKILMHDNTPYQRFIDADQFRLVQTGTYQVNDEIRIGTKTVMTQKGIDYLVKRLNKALS